MSDDDLIPEGFDLKSAMYARSSTPQERMPRCPECGAVVIVKNVDAHPTGPEAEATYRCGQCREPFDSPEVPD